MANPHFTVAKEVVRVSSPGSNRDAVLRLISGTSYALYVVKSGQETYGQSWLCVFIHVNVDNGVQVRWVSPSELNVEITCDDVSFDHETPVVKSTEMNTYGIRLHS